MCKNYLSFIGLHNQVAVFKAKLQRAEEENKLLRATQAASRPHLATVSSPAKTDFRDASLLARVTASAGNRVGFTQ